MDVLDSHPLDPLNGWDLREAGADGVFGNEDDDVYDLRVSPGYSGGTTVNLRLFDGPMHEGQYRLMLTPSLADPVGNLLDGDGDGVGGDAFTRTFHVDLPEGFVYESRSNNSRSTATPLPLVEDPVDSGYYLGHGLGSIDPAVYNDPWNESDYWSFEAQAGDRVAVAVGTPNSGLNPYVYLYNASGNSLTGDDDAGPGSDAYISHYTVPTDGTYYARVGHYRYSGTVGNYQLRVELARGIDLESDANYHNDSSSQADPVTLTGVGIDQMGTVAGTIMSPEGSNTDGDCYALGVLNVDNVVELDVRLPSSSTVLPRVRVLDADGNLVPDEDGDDWDGHFLATIALDGPYYAQVSSAYWVHEGRRYLNIGSRTWSDAEAYAQSLGGHLVTINDQAEQDWLYSTFRGFGDIWIGINDVEEEGTWVWSSGEPVAYTNWAGDEPNSGGSYDGAFVDDGNGLWYDRHNTNSLRGVVEWEDPEGRTGIGPGPLGQYLLDIDISDPVPPQVASIGRLPAEGGTTSQMLSTFDVTMSEALDPSTVNTPVYNFTTYGGHTYLLTSSQSWSDARAYAQGLGGELVTINDQAEQDWLYATYGSQGFWIGINDAEVEGTWVWSSGAPVDYTNWYGSEPNSGSDYDYAYLNDGNGQWYDGHNTSSRVAVVELGLGADSDGPGGRGRLPARGSHRPERAQLTHSVPQVTRSLRGGTPSGLPADKALGSAATAG